MRNFKILAVLVVWMVEAIVPVNIFEKHYGVPCTVLCKHRCNANMINYTAAMGLGRMLST